MPIATDAPQTPKDRFLQATEHLKKLEAELGQLQTRKQAVGSAIEALNVKIALEERSGDQELLVALRAERRDAGELLQDLTRSIATVEGELTTARGNLHTCRVACETEAYNTIVGQQRKLTDTIEQAVQAIVMAVSNKQQLAITQAHMIAWMRLNPLEIRHVISSEIAKRLTTAEGRTSIRSIDWTYRRMVPGGTLEA